MPKLLQMQPPPVRPKSLFFQIPLRVKQWHLAWQPAFLIVVLLYFYSHYLFASGAAHIGAMYTAFLSVLVACGAPPVPSA